MQTPDYYLPIMPYLVIKNAKEFIVFLKKVFNAQERMIVPREDGSIMHGEISIGKAVVLFTDATDEYKPFPGGMFLQVENIDEVYKSALANGATSTQELDNRDYGRSAGFQDAFGNQWWLSKPE
ncbi:VOC family protein [Chitinophagaceae bacterium LWZ2-11]